MQPISALVFLIALFAETNRLPFDMPESETDLVGGFHTEYGSFKFGIFFVAEYAHIVIGSALFTLLFLEDGIFFPSWKIHGHSTGWVLFLELSVSRQNHFSDLLFYLDPLDDTPLSLRSSYALGMDKITPFGSI